jgi:hypothetical protein
MDSAGGFGVAGAVGRPKSVWYASTFYKNAQSTIQPASVTQMKERWGV